VEYVEHVSDTEQLDSASIAGVTGSLPIQGKG
jgi:hypothetical protein